MYRLRLRLNGSGQDGRHVQVAVLHTGGTNADALIRQADVEGVTIRLTEHGNRDDPHLLAGADDAHGNFTAIRNQDLRKHSAFLLPFLFVTSQAQS